MKKLTILLSVLALLFLGASPLCAQPRRGPHKKPLPVIDMHLHAMRADEEGPPPLAIGLPFYHWGYNDPKNNYGPTFMEGSKSEWAKRSTTSPLTDDLLRTQTLKALEDNNVYGVTSGSPELVRKWHAENPKRIIKAVLWDFDRSKKGGLNVELLTKLFKSGEFRVFGEVTIQYEGFSPNVPAFEPYLKMAEDLDIPLGIHVGPGPPGVIYLGAKNYRASLHSALGLEEALVKHPKLRVYAMHAGWPMLDDMITTLYAHPQLNVDLGIISYAIPEKEYYFYLERLVNAGFGKRIMFGSDNMVWPETIKFAIGRINNAKFLTKEQKRDILFNNAARFLRLTPEQIKAMN